jgi:DNA primase
MMQDESDREESRVSVIIPFTYNNSVVGYTQRFLDDRTPKYINFMPANYVFGTDLQQDNWQNVIVVEGIFDALSIDGVAVMHNTVSDPQAQLIRRLGKEVIVVPDQDPAGMALVDRAIELGWSVSMPNWPNGCKDVNDAVIKLGKLTALMTIMQARETSRIKIEMRKKQFIKKP